MTELATNLLYCRDNLDILRRYLPDASISLVSTADPTPSGVHHLTAHDMEASAAPGCGVRPGRRDMWALPNPAGASTQLAGGLELELVQRVADWARVRASNGWSGWVDARRLAARTPPPA